MTDIRPFSMVINPARPFITNTLASPIRRRTRGSPPLRTAERGDLQPKDGHDRTRMNGLCKRSAREGNAHPRPRRGALEIPGQVGKLLEL